MARLGRGYPIQAHVSHVLIGPTSARTLAVAGTTESSTARPLSRKKSLPIAGVVESDVAGALTATRAHVVSGTAEADVTGALSRHKSLAVVGAHESDSAGSLTITSSGASPIVQMAFHGGAQPTTVDASSGWVAPHAGNIIVALTNSDALENPLSGFTLRASHTFDQALYVWDKVSDGTETSVTVTTVSPDNTTLVLAELDKNLVAGFDQIGIMAVPTSAANVTAPSAVARGTNGDLAFAVAALHGADAAVGFTWGNGFTELTGVQSGAGEGATDMILRVATKQVAQGPVGDTLLSWTGTVPNLTAVHVLYRLAGDTHEPFNNVLGPYDPVTKDTGDGSAITVGWSFSVASDVVVRRARVLISEVGRGHYNAGDVIQAAIWHYHQDGSGQEIAFGSYTWAGTEKSGWIDIPLADDATGLEPVLPAETTDPYVVGVFLPHGYYSAQSGFFASAPGYTAGPIHAFYSGEDAGNGSPASNGLYSYNATRHAPADSFNQTWYGVDVEWATSGTAPASIAVGGVTESDAAHQVLIGLKTAIGPVAESDVVQQLGRSKKLTVVGTVESDVVRSIGLGKGLVVGGVAEQDASHAVGRAKRLTVGHVTEADAAASLSRKKLLATSGVVEANIARQLSRSKSRLVAGTFEIDAAHRLGSQHRLTVGTVLETEAAGKLRLVSFHAVVGTFETDVTHSVARRKDLILGLALESETSHALSRHKARGVAGVLEAEPVEALQRVKSLSVVTLTESDVVGALSRSKLASVGLAQESDAVFALSRDKLLTLSTAHEVNVARNLGFTIPLAQFYAILPGPVYQPLEVLFLDETGWHL